jgi:hypothetical protein
MNFVRSTRSIFVKNDEGKAFRLQLPKLKVTGMNEYGKMEFEVNEEFTKVWNDIDGECREYATLQWSENPKDGKFRVKIDEKTHIFNSHSELESDPKFVGRFVTCIIEIQSVYTFKGYSGITCRIHQLKIHDPVCLFTEDD